MSVMVRERVLLRAARRNKRRGDISRDEYEIIVKVCRDPERELPDGETVNLLDELEEAIITDPCIDLPARYVTREAGRLRPRWDGSFIDWLIENLPAILEILMAILALF
jgi:hypothetical protein